jgi:hypothetical protein
MCAITSVRLVLLQPQASSTNLQLTFSLPLNFWISETASCADLQVRKPGQCVSLTPLPDNSHKQFHDPLISKCSPPHESFADGSMSGKAEVAGLLPDVPRGDVSFIHMLTQVKLRP